MGGDELQVKTAGLTYRVLIEKGSLSEIGKNMRLLFPSSRVLLVSDTNVFSLYGETVLKSLKAEKWQVSVKRIRPGERSKTLISAGRLYDAAAEADLDRNSPVLALGGGVVGDLAGFAAATYKRGVPLVMVPTSLLAQVDSSVGGKVAVNHPRGKNLIGTIYPPGLVLIDPLVLNTLPEPQLHAGLAEVIKYGIIENSDFFYWLEQNIEQLLAGESSRLAEAISRSVRSKAGVVEEDEYERDYRRILNFGHTIGHALEAATLYTYYLHGEAILIGMKGAVEIARQLSRLKATDAGRINKLLDRLPLKKPPAGLTAEKVIDKLRQDKKRRESDLVFVLPESIGSASMVTVGDERLIREVLGSYLDLPRNWQI
jgi:3-dehydroquinate synthase